MTAVATAPTCEARVGFYAGEWSEMPVYCSARIGLTTWTDRNGTTRRACRHHVEAMRARFGVQEEERVARVISEASRPLRAFERRTVVVEEGPGYVVTADAEDWELNIERTEGHDPAYSEDARFDRTSGRESF